MAWLTSFQNLNPQRIHRYLLQQHSFAFPVLTELDVGLQTQAK